MTIYRNTLGNEINLISPYLLFAVLLSLCLPSYSASKLSTTTSQDHLYELNIAHVNDHHSNMRPFPTTLTLDNQITQVEIGGFARLSTLFNSVSDKPNLLKLHAGDAITGTPYYSFFDGEADAIAMNNICFDAFIPGNHEFDSGDSGLKKFLDFLANSSECKTPVLAANIHPAPGTPLAQRPDGTPYFQPYLIKNMGNVKIGIIGIDVKGKTLNSSRPLPTTHFDDETTAAQLTINSLKSQGVNHIILMSHIGYEADKAMAPKLTDVDIIIGGDSHTLLGDFTSVGLNSSQGAYPTIVKNKNGNIVCIGQAWEYSKVFALMNVKFNPDGTVNSCEGNSSLILGSNSFSRLNTPLSQTEAIDLAEKLATNPSVKVTANDPSYTKKLSSFDERYVRETEKIIGTLRSDSSLCLVRVPGSANRGGPICNLVNQKSSGSDIAQIVTEGLRQAYTGNLKGYPVADMSITVVGGVRAPLETDGKNDLVITKEMAYRILPYPNELYSIQITGAQVKSVLEEGISNWLDNGNSDGSHPYASGLRWSLDLSAPKHHRISHLEVKNQQNGAWSPIVPDHVYLTIETDYMRQGFEGYDTFREICAIPGKCSTAGGIYGDESLINYVGKTLKNGVNQGLVPLTKPACQEYSHQNVILKNGEKLDPTCASIPK